MANVGGASAANPNGSRTRPLPIRLTEGRIVRGVKQSGSKLVTPLLVRSSTCSFVRLAKVLAFRRPSVAPPEFHGPLPKASCRSAELLGGNSCAGSDVRLLRFS